MSHDLYFHRIDLPSPYTLHLLRYMNQPCIMSKEISSWFWEADLLQFHLKKTSNKFPNVTLHRESVPNLFQALVESQSPLLWEALGINTITLYSLKE